MAADRSPSLLSRAGLVPFVLALSGLLAACGASAAGGAWSADHSAGPGDVTVRVVNQHFQDVRVSFLQADVMIPLGTVGSMHTRDFRIEGGHVAASGTIQLRADPSGTEPAMTLPAVPVREQGVVEWVLAPDLRHSSVRVR